MYRKGEVVQFNENHKWCGSFGIIHEVTQRDNDVRYLIGVPIPEQGTAFIFSMESDNEFEFIGFSIFVLGEDNAES